jgi:hypothetical protein
LFKHLVAELALRGKMILYTPTFWKWSRGSAPRSSLFIKARSKPRTASAGFAT